MLLYNRNCYYQLVTQRPVEIPFSITTANKTLYAAGYPIPSGLSHPMQSIAGVIVQLDCAVNAASFHFHLGCTAMKNILSPGNFIVDNIPLNQSWSMEFPHPLVFTPGDTLEYRCTDFTTTIPTCTGRILLLICGWEPVDDAYAAELLTAGVDHLYWSENQSHPSGDLKYVGQAVIPFALTGASPEFKLGVPFNHKMLLLSATVQDTNTDPTQVVRGDVGLLFKPNASLGSGADRIVIPAPMLIPVILRMDFDPHPEADGKLVVETPVDAEEAFELAAGETSLIKCVEAYSFVADLDNRTYGLQLSAKKDAGTDTAKLKAQFRILTGATLSDPIAVTTITEELTTEFATYVLTASVSPRILGWNERFVVELIGIRGEGSAAPTVTIKDASIHMGSMSGQRFSTNCAVRQYSIPILPTEFSGSTVTAMPYSTVPFLPQLLSEGEDVIVKALNAGVPNQRGWLHAVFYAVDSATTSGLNLPKETYLIPELATTFSGESFHLSIPLHGVFPAESLFTLSVPLKIPPFSQFWLRALSARIEPGSAIDGSGVNMLRINTPTTEIPGTHRFGGQGINLRTQGIRTVRFQAIGLVDGLELEMTLTGTPYRPFRVGLTLDVMAFKEN
jgi:hypothetical protein